jgi:cell division topological specificity factor
MSMFHFRSRSAPIARERLQILLAHERTASSHPDLLGVLREEILAIIGRHVTFEPDKVHIKMNRGKSVSTLAVDIEIPNVTPRTAGVMDRNARLTPNRSCNDSVVGLGVA